MCDRLVNSQSILKPILLVAGHWCQHLLMYGVACSVIFLLPVWLMHDGTLCTSFTIYENGQTHISHRAGLDTEDSWHGWYIHLTYIR